MNSHHDVPSLSESISRTHLLLAHLGKVNSLGETRQWREKCKLHLDVGKDACEDEFAQFAAITAVTLAVRAECSVSFSLGDPDCPVIVGAKSGNMGNLTDKLTSLGASISDIPIESVVIGIGDSRVVRNSHAPHIQLTWDGWVGAVRPLGTRLAERPGCILSAIVAAGLGVSEAFHYLIGHLDAGWRDLTLSLWDPLAADPLLDVGPYLEYWPDKWTLIGLGHLGQANAWCISALPYRRGECEVWLVDNETISQANVSTGVLTSLADVRTPPLNKTRMISRFLEEFGHRTQMIEMRLPESYVWEPGHPDTALIGVDNLHLRKKLSEIGWPLCVDVGLGSKPSSFASLSIHVFPGPQLSSQVLSWKSTSNQLAEDDLSPAFVEILRQTRDHCGVLMLAERAVATAFVGMTAACFAVAEPLRRLNGGSGLGALSLVLDTLTLRGATAFIDV